MSRTRGLDGPFKGDTAHASMVWENGGLGMLDEHRSPYKVWTEDFDSQFPDADLNLRGATVSAINTPTAATELVGVTDQYLLLNPGTKADSGSEVQFDIVGTGTAANDIRPHSILGAVTSSTTFMDGKELFFQTRVGIRVHSASTVYDGKILIGWMAKEASILNGTTGAPAVVDGGGFGFHINGDAGDGSIDIFSDPAAFTSLDAPTDRNATRDLAAVATETFVWYVLSARMRVTDASASTGLTEFWIDGRPVGSIEDSCCMDSTEVYSMTYAYLNGPAQDFDLALDYVRTGITRAGLSYPYSTGVW